MANAANGEKSLITSDELKSFYRHPHIFGYVLGFKDLIPIHSEWIINAWLKKDKNAMQAHRNSYKTTSILIIGTIWYLLFHDPDVSILIIRKSDSDAQKVVSAIRDLFEFSPVIQYIAKLYKIDTFRTDNWTKSSITISTKKTVTPEGSVECKGSTSAITGSHYDFIFPDDIITLKDRVSSAEREWIKDFIRELRNIKKEGGKIFFSGTPWHKQDGWVIIPEPERYPIGTVPIKGHLAGQLPDKIKELKAGTTTSLYAANYDLQHIADEDTIFPEPIYANWPKEGISPNAWLDTAYTGDSNTALTMIGKHNDKWHCRGWTWRKHVVDLYPEIISLLNQYNCGTLYVETNADKGAAVRDISQRYPNVQGRHEKMNKHNKIVSYGKQNFGKLSFAHDCQPEFINQIMEYTENMKPDDAPDCMSSLLRELGFSGGFNFVAIGANGAL